MDTGAVASVLVDRVIGVGDEGGCDGVTLGCRSLTSVLAMTDGVYHGDGLRREILHKWLWMCKNLLQQPEWWLYHPWQDQLSSKSAGAVPCFGWLCMCGSASELHFGFGPLLPMLSDGRCVRVLADHEVNQASAGMQERIEYMTSYVS